MSRGKIIGVILLIGTLLLLFAFVRSCHSGSEVMDPAENEESVDIPSTAIPARPAPAQPADTSAVDTAAVDTAAVQ